MDQNIRQPSRSADGSGSRKVLALLGATLFVVISIYAARIAPCPGHAGSS